MTAPLQSSLVTVKGRDGFHWALAIDAPEGIAVIEVGYEPFLNADDFWDHQKVIRKVTTAVRELRAIPGGYVELTVFNRTLRGSMQAHSFIDAPILVMPASSCSDGLATYRAALSRIEEGQPELHPDYAPIAEVDIIHVHTDGSASRGSRSHVGYGWIADNGRFGYGAEQGGHAHVGELWAIARALEGLQRTPSRDLVVHSDSQGVIDTVRGILRGATVIDGYDTATRKPLRVIAEMGRRRNVTLTWVRGHAGDPANEAADRLAVLGRRNHEADLSRSDARPIAQRIVSDLQLSARLQHVGA